MEKLDIIGEKEEKMLIKIQSRKNKEIKIEKDRKVGI